MNADCSGLILGVKGVLDELVQTKALIVVLFDGAFL